MKKNKLFCSACILSILSMAATLIATETPDAKELLLRFAEARKNFNSFVVETETESTTNVPELGWGGKSYSEVNYSFDGARAKDSTLGWGYLGYLHPNVLEDKPHYYSNMWDGENSYSYVNTGPSSKGNLILVRSKDPGGVPESGSNITKGATITGEMMGYHWGDGGKRIDEVLAQAENIDVRQEKFRGSDCHVLEAKVREKGKYTVWIDPAHDYYIAKIHVIRGEND